MQEMTMNLYQQLAGRTANMNRNVVIHRLIQNEELLPLLNFSLGAAGEAGEIADEVKKVVFHGHSPDREKLVKEFGDLLWYVSQLAEVLDCDFGEVAFRNIEKLRKRYPNGFSEEASRNREVEKE